MVHPEVITRGLGVLVSLITVIFSVQILKRFAGKLKISVIFLMIAVILIFLANTSGILEIFFGYDTSMIRAVANIWITVMILLTVISMKEVINGIDGHYRKK